MTQINATTSRSMYTECGGAGGMKTSGNNKVYQMTKSEHTHLQEKSGLLSIYVIYRGAFQL